MELNQFRNVDVVLDKANDNFIQRQFVSAGDKDGRSLTVQLTDNGVIGEIIGAALNLYWHNQASGLTDLSAFYVVDRATSVFKIDYPQNMLTPGKVIAYIQILHGGKVTHTKPFEITVQKLAGTTRGVLATAEYGVLVKTLAKANEFETDIAVLGNGKVDKGGNEQVTIGMLSQQVKEIMAGANALPVVGDKSVNTSNVVDEAITPAKTTFLEKLTIKSNDFNSFYGLFSKSNPTITESISQTNACFYFETREKDITINISAVPKYLYIGSTQNEPEIGDTVSNILMISDGTLVYDDSKSYRYKVAENHRYVVVRFWNTADVENLEMIKQRFSIVSSALPNFESKLKNDVYIDVNNDNVKDGALSITKVHGLDSKLSDLLSKADDRNFNRRYVTIKNPSNFDRDDFIQIKMSFEIGECKSSDCLRIFSDGTEHEYQFDQVEVENFVRYADATYYPDGSVRACVLWIKDNLPALQNKIYEIRVYANNQDLTFNKNITMIDNPSDFKVTDNSNSYTFNKDDFNLQSINNKTFFDDSRIKIGGVTKRLKTLEIISRKTSGNGVLFKDVTRLVKHDDDVLFLQNYRIFVGGRLDVTLKSLVLQDTPDAYIESIYSGFETVAGDVVVSESGEHYYTMQNESQMYAVSPIYTNGNTQRDSTTLPVYPSKIYTSFNATRNVFLAGWDYYGAKTYPIAKNNFFSSRYIIDLDAKSSTKLSQYVPIVGYATDQTVNQTLKRAKRLIIDHIEHLKGYALSKVNLDYFNLAYPYLALYDYQFNDGSIDDVIDAFNQTFNVKFSGETADTFMDDYESGLGIHISGRFIQSAYLIYKVLDKLNDSRAVRFKNISVNYGKFLSNIWSAKNDVPMSYPSGTTNNGRATALSCMAIAIKLSDDATIKVPYDGLSNLISQATRVNTILPDGNLSTSRYLHYSSFAMYELAKASLLVDTSIVNLTSYTNNLIDCIHPTGQLKDMTYCSSDSRRGLGHTYSYTIGALLLKGDYGDKALAVKSLEWLVGQDLPFDNQVFPLDDYKYNPSQKYDGALPFELISLIEIVL